MFRMLLTLTCLCVIGCLQGPTGPAGSDGARGPAGTPGETLAILTSSGTILNKNYTGGNPAFAALRVCDCIAEPTILFVGIENVNGVMTNTPWTAITYSNGTDTYGYDGLAGYYVLVSDASKVEVQKNFKVKFTGL